MKHVEWLYRNKTCTVLHQVGVSFDLIFILFRSSSTWPIHLNLGLPAGLVLYGVHSVIFLEVLVSSILITWAAYLCLCDFINCLSVCPLVIILRPCCSVIRCVLHELCNTPPARSCIQLINWNEFPKQSHVSWIWDFYVAVPSLGLWQWHWGTKFRHTQVHKFEELSAVRIATWHATNRFARCRAHPPDRPPARTLDFLRNLGFLWILVSRSFYRP